MQFLTTLAYALDRAFAALFFGAIAGETVSILAARAQVDGRGWGCLLCRALDILVVRGHCVQALDTGDGPTSGAAAIRSGVLLFGLALLLSLAAAAAWAAVALLVDVLLAVVR